MKFLPLPQAFDENEWFIILSLLVFSIICLTLPKRFPLILSVTLWLFNATLSKSVDYTIAAALPLDLYDYDDTGKLELFDEILQFFLYPLVGYMMMYWYDVWRARGLRRVWFVLLAAGISSLYEWFSVQAHVFTYKGWHLAYSSVAYVILLSCNIYFLHLLKKWLPHEREPS